MRSFISLLTLLLFVGFSGCADDFAGPAGTELAPATTELAASDVSTECTTSVTTAAAIVRGGIIEVTASQVTNGALNLTFQRSINGGAWQTFATTSATGSGGSITVTDPAYGPGGSSDPKAEYRTNYFCRGDFLWTEFSAPSNRIAIGPVTSEF